MEEWWVSRFCFLEFLCPRILQNGGLGFIFDLGSCLPYPGIGTTSLWFMNAGNVLEAHARSLGIVTFIVLHVFDDETHGTGIASVVQPALVSWNVR